MNVAVVVLDTLRKDAISPYDHGVDHTPNLASFAEEATVYDNAVAQAPWSLPSQASLLTGRYPWQHGAGQRQPYLPSGEPLLQERLRSAGYRTAAVHENSWLVPATGAMRGFDHLETPADGSGRVAPLWRALNSVPGGHRIGRRLVLGLSARNRKSGLAEPTDSTAFLDGAAAALDAVGDDDFFLFLNPLNAHYPYTPPATYAERHDASVSCERLGARPLEYGGDGIPTDRDAVRRLYDAEVDYLDDVFGQLMDLFEERGLDEDTLVVVLSDHGELLGEDDLLGHHFSVRPEVTEVPLMLRRPDGGSGRETAVTEVRELYYEILTAAGLSAADDERLLEDRAAGIYGMPRIYRERLPPERSDLDKPRFYLSGPSRHESSASMARAILTQGGNAIGARLRAGRRSAAALGTVAELD